MDLSGHSSITLHTSIVTMLKSGDYKSALKLVDEALPLDHDNDTLSQLRDTLIEKLHLQEGDETDSEDAESDDEQQELATSVSAPATTAPIATTTTTTTTAAAAAGGGCQQPAAAGTDGNDDAGSNSDSSGADGASTSGSDSSGSDVEGEQHLGLAGAAHLKVQPSPSTAAGADAEAGRLVLDPSSFLLTRQQRSKLRAQFGAARRQQLAAQLVMNDPLLGC